MALRDFLKRKSKQHNIDEKIVTEACMGRGNMSEAYPSDFTQDEISQIQRVRQYTMTSSERLVTLLRSIDYIYNNKIKGDIVECGVWKGGSMMLIANKLVSLNSQERNLFLLDTFEGMSDPTGLDVTFHNQSASELLAQQEKNDNSDNIWCYSTLDEVKKNIATTGYDKDKLQFIQGKVEHTLPNDKINNIALLRLDTDWYESTKHELETLYDKLALGGVLIIDDYGHWSGAKKAVDDFIKDRQLKVFLNRVDYTCRLAIKF